VTSFAREVTLRVLFTYAGGSGHADPLVPVADAVRAAGHDVAFFGRRSAAAALDADGFTLFPDTDDRALAAGDDAPITPLLELDMEREYRDLRGFADRIARARMAGTLELADHWRPDLLVCDEADYGSMLGAERLRLPHATVLTNASGSFLRAVDIAEPLDAIRVELGLPPDPRLTMPARDLVIAPFPPSFRDPAFRLPGNAISIRPDPGRSLPGSAPDWLSHLPDAPTVYFTLGTIFNQESGDLFDRVLAGLRDLPVTVIVTVGRSLDPDRFGPQPDNVHVERYVPQTVLLPHCDLVVNHGGSGSVIGALAHGLPLVVLPMGADQLPNAQRCEQLGVGVTLDAVRVTPRSIRDTTSALLRDAHAREAAERIRDEIASLPGPEAAVPMLERLVERDRSSPSA
jgi:UDP:flavonoid glycosyltransferase YjiC (YdhE family)